MVFCSSVWTVYGFSPPSPVERRAAASSRPRSMSAPATAGGRSPSASTYSAAPSPARRPKTSRSDSELPPEPVRAVHAARDLAGGEQARDADGRAGVGLDLDAAHDVVAGRTDLHRLGGDVDVGQLLELVVHRRQLACGSSRPAAGVGDVEEDAAVR